MRRRYLFFDIDGTLAAGPIEHRYVPESAQEALRRLREAGHFTAIATGRSHAMARSYMEEQGFKDMVCDGGKGIVLDGELVALEPLEREPCIRLLEECEEKGVPWAASTDDSRHRVAVDGRFDAAIAESYMETIVDPGFDFHEALQFNKLYLACSQEEEALLERLAEVPSARFSRDCLFIEPVDKGEGIRRMMAYFKAPLEDVVVFGDGSNDFSMFCPEWTCVAMGNAIEGLKERADLVTTDADDDGILNACLALGLI